MPQRRVRAIKTDMKPNIFLSHSKADKPLIEQIANDLRCARISVWYDEWEIPTGESFRRKIFEDGIPTCDVFFVYLSPASIKSYWVSKELDAAFVREAGSKGLAFATFVSDENIRTSLSLDLQSLHSPVLNDRIYTRPILQLTSRVWEVVSEKRLRAEAESHRTKLVELEKENAQLENQILRFNSIGTLDIEKIEELLAKESFVFDGTEVNLLEGLQIWANQLAVGTMDTGLASTINSYFGSDSGKDAISALYYFSSSDAMGKLVILGLVTARPADEHNYKTYYLTDLGVKVVQDIYRNS